MFCFVPGTYSYALRTRQRPSGRITSVQSNVEVIVYCVILNVYEEYRGLVSPQSVVCVTVGISSGVFQYPR